MAINKPKKGITIYTDLGAGLWADAKADAREEIPLQDPREGELLAWILGEYVDRELAAASKNAAGKRRELVVHGEMCQRHPDIEPTGKGGALVAPDNYRTTVRKCGECYFDGSLAEQIRQNGGDIEEI